MAFWAEGGSLRGSRSRGGYLRKGKSGCHSFAAEGWKFSRLAITSSPSTILKQNLKQRFLYGMSSPGGIVAAMRDTSSNGFHSFGDRLKRRFDGLTHLSPDEAYLSYHDILLTKEDFNTLRHNDWLTDNVISFWEEYLEHECLAKHPDANVVLLRPSMSFLLVQTADPHTLKEALPNFSKTTHIFLPINDCRDPTRPEGGSHWSLLLVSVQDRMAFHYDSLSSVNEDDARRVSAKLAKLLDTELRFRDITDTPQQDNGSDCGVYVCSIMRYLLMKRLLVTPRAEKRSMSMGDVNIIAAAERKEMVKTIEAFRKQGEKLRSRSTSPLPDRQHRGSTSGSGRTPPRIGDD